MDNPHVLSVRVNAPIGALPLEVTFFTKSPWTVLFGPSGSGKSTLLRVITGLWQPQDSEIFLDTIALAKTPPHKRRIALVAQQTALFPNMTVRQNIAFGSDRGSDAEQWITELMEAFGLSALASAKPATLSGGERQRTAIARALGSRPQYLLLDEVFTGMHAAQRQLLMATLRTYSERLNMPILSVTHDVAEALQADEVIKIDDGRVIAQGPAVSVLANEREALQQQLNDAGTPRMASVPVCRPSQAAF
jgi:molybdate transport system ATP-binding protein